MTLEEILALWEKMQPLVKNAPHRLSEETVTELSNNESFQKKLDTAAKCQQKLNNLHALTDKYGTPPHLDNLNRFVPFLLVEENTDEDRERNEDLIEMLYCPEGRDALVEMAIRATLGGDLSVAFSTSEDDAIEQAGRNPCTGELMYIALNLLTERSVTMDPLVRAQLDNFQTALMNSADAVNYLKFYGEGYACALGTDMDISDVVAILPNLSSFIDQFEIPDVEKMNRKSAVNSVLTNVVGIGNDRREQLRNTYRELRDEGIIGPESMFYRTYGEDGKPIPFMQAVIDRSEGKAATFRRMSPAEQKELTNAMLRPITRQEPTNVGPTDGQGLRNSFREMYNLLDENDNMFIRSSKQFRDLKKIPQELRQRQNGA